MAQNRHLNTLATHFLGWRGRISRSEWWLCWGADLALAYVFYLVFESSAYKAIGFTLPQMVASAFLLWAATCANIKRFHDRNKPWLWVLIAFIPVIGTAWVLIELGLMSGTKGRNAFGDDPLDTSQTPLPPLSLQLAEARADILRQFQTAFASKGKLSRDAPPPKQKTATIHALQQPLIQYGYKRPERTVTRG